MTIMGIHVQGKDYRIESIDANVQKTMASSPEGWMPLKSYSKCVFQVPAPTKTWPCWRGCPRLSSGQKPHPDVAQNLAFQFYRV